MITFRQAFPDECNRAASLCQPSPAFPGDGETRCFLAVKSRPVERIVGTAFWKERKESGETLAVFEWAMVAAMHGHPEEAKFLKALAAAITGEHPGISRIRASAWLDPQCPDANPLLEAGFKESASREIFTANVPAWRKVLEGMPEGNSPASEVTRAHADEIRTLLQGTGISDAELAHGFVTAGGENPSLFDFSSSAILCREGKATGVCLARTNASHTHISFVAFGLKKFSEEAIAPLLKAAMSKPMLREISLQRVRATAADTNAAADPLGHILAKFPNSLFSMEKRYEFKVT